MKFDKIDWGRAFFKTYLEKRSFLHLLVNFNRIWVSHISMFWFYTAYNSPTIYSPKNSTSPERAMTWSVTALGSFPFSHLSLRLSLPHLLSRPRLTASLLFFFFFFFQVELSPPSS